MRHNIVATETTTIRTTIKLRLKALAVQFQTAGLFQTKVSK